MKVKAVPMPATKNGPARSRQKFPFGGAWAAHRIPAPIRAIPTAMTALGEVRVTSFWERPAKASEVTDAVIQASPGRQRGEPEDLLHVEGADEDEGQEARARAGSRPRWIRPRSSSRNRRSGSSGASTLRLDDEERRQQRRRRRRAWPRSAAAPQPTCGACEMAYTKTSSAGGDRDGAERVVAPPGRVRPGSRARAWGVSASAAAPMGTLKKKMYGHPT